MLDYLVFNGVSSTDFNVYLSGAGAFELPKRDVSKIQIPGRNGDLIVDNGRYENVEIEYPMIIMEDFEMNKRNLVRAFSASRGYERLEDTFQPDYFRLAHFEGISKSKTNWHYDAGSFIATFDCKPQLYLKSGEQPMAVSYSQSVTVENPTNEEALPLIRITGTGYFKINDDTFRLTSNGGLTIVDSEAREVYEGTTNRNDDFERNNNELPKLYTGTNVVSVLTAEMQIEMIPRWWTI